MAEKLQPGKIHGDLNGRGFRFGIAVSRFNSFITDRLLSAAVDALERSGAQSADVDIVGVPGSFELPRNDSLRLCLRGNFSRVATRPDGHGRPDNFLRAHL